MNSRPLERFVKNPASAFRGDHCVALDGLTPVPWHRCVDSYRRWCRALAQAPANHRYVHLYHQDAVEFLAALLAIWRSGKVAVLPPNTLPATLEELARISPTAIGELPSSLTKATGAPMAEDEAPALVPTDEQADLQALLLFTSGSSGEPVKVGKTFRQIENELRTLERTWGNDLADAPVFATVSHQHIYGLLFRLLWPLCAGRPFSRKALLYWEEVEAAARAFPQSALATSPAHLAHIPHLAAPLGLARIFSSGAPLAPNHASVASARLGSPITEVYGSTETGGIAWKHHSDRLWSPFVGVTLRTLTHVPDAPPCLQVSGSHLPLGVSHDTQDRVVLYAEHKFELLGRADRIAKICGKRISLNRLEQCLETHEWVREARVLRHPLAQARLAAVVVLNDEGLAFLRQYRKNALNRTLRRALADQVEAVALPRFWRYPGALPRNSQGKVTHAELTNLFFETLKEDQEKYSCNTPSF